MVKINFIKKLMVVGEREQLKGFEAFVDLSSEATKVLIQMFRQSDDTLYLLNDKIQILEKKGDLLSVSLKDQITGGAISSNIIDNLLNLIDVCDDILDKSYFVSREIKRAHADLNILASVDQKMLEREYNAFVSILNKNLDALAYVKTIFRSDDLDEIEDSRIRIQELEEAVDDVKDNLIDELYGYADQIPYPVFAYLTGLTHKLDGLLDDCEDIGDMLHFITIASYQ